MPAAIHIYMSWIDIINYDKATSNLKRLYDRIKGPDNNVDNVMLIHSLRPHTLLGHMTLYKNVLHNSNNTLPKWYLEALGIYVSHLNKCDYCFEHHFEGFKRIYPEPEKADLLRDAVVNDRMSDFFDAQYVIGAEHAKQLTLHHHTISKENIEQLRQAGFSDGEILEINQVVSYFNYVNRTVVGLGVNTEGDILGLSPGNNDNPDNWKHV